MLLKTKGQGVLDAAAQIAAMVLGRFPTIQALAQTADGGHRCARLGGPLRKGQINLPTPDQAESNPPSVQYDDEVGRELGSQRPVKPGVVVTGDDSYLDLLQRRLDHGRRPNTVFKVEELSRPPTASERSCSRCSGKVRTLVTRSLDGGSSYRGNAHELDGRARHRVGHQPYPFNGHSTDVVLEGKVVVDMPKLASMAGARAPARHAGQDLRASATAGRLRSTTSSLNNEQIREITAMIRTSRPSVWVRSP